MMILQRLALYLIYAQMACALIGSLAPLYNGVLLLHLAVSLFALVAIESSNQSLARTSASLLFCSFFLDLFWFFLYSHHIWHIPSDLYGTFASYSVKLMLAMQIVGFSARLLSLLLWIQMYRLGVSHIDNSTPRDTDVDLRNSFLNPATPSIVRLPSGSDDVEGSTYDPGYYSSLLGDTRDGTYQYGEGSQPQPSVTSAMNFPSTLPSLIHGSSFSSVPSSSSIIKSESLTSSQPSASICGLKPEGISEIQSKVDNMPSKTETGVKIETSASQPELPIFTSGLKLALPALTGLSTNSKSEIQDDLGGSSKNSSVIKVEMPSATEALPTVALSNEGINGSMKNVVPNSSHEEEMEEEVPETEQTTEFEFANLDGFGIGPTQNSTTPKANPFGVGVLNTNTTFATSPYTMSGSSSELFRPAFSFQSPQAPQPLQPTTVKFSGGFNSGVPPGQVSAAAGFGQPAQIGAGQQALGSVLGSFGQSRQIGTGLPGSNAAPASGFGSGFTGISAGGFGGGFATAPSGGGFASLAAGGGGFAAAATGGGGFAGAATEGGGFATGGGEFAGAATGGGGFAAAGGGFATGGGGFASAATGGGGFATGGGGFAGASTGGGGFAGAATVGGGFAGAGGGFMPSATAGTVSGGGFGAFSNQPCGGGFSEFGGGSGVGRPPSELFTQMRKKLDVKRHPK